MSGYRDQKKCDICGRWLDPLEKCGCLSTTPPPAPVGEREEYSPPEDRAEASRRQVLPLVQYYLDLGQERPVVKRYDLALIRDALQARASSPAPVLELTSEERQLCIDALKSADQFLLNGDEYSKGRARDLIIGVRRKLARLTTPAAGAADRLTHEAADAPDERAAMELRYGLREEDLP